MSTCVMTKHVCVSTAASRPQQYASTMQRVQCAARRAAQERAIVQLGFVSAHVLAPSTHYHTSHIRRVPSRIS